MLIIVTTKAIIILEGEILIIYAIIKITHNL